MRYLPDQDVYIHNGYIYHISKREFEMNKNKSREFNDYTELISCESGIKGFLPVICSDIKTSKNGKSVFATFLDYSGSFNKLISGNRKVNGKWTRFDTKIEKGKSYLLWCRVDHDYPDEFEILRVKELE